MGVVLAVLGMGGTLLVLYLLGLLVTLMKRLFPIPVEAPAAPSPTPDAPAPEGAGG